MNQAVSNFLSKHSFTQHLDINTAVDALLFDMRKGINGQDADEDMIRTWTNPPSKSVSGKSVIVIDAGGTNFRSCLVTFDEQGKAEISFMEKTSMPGIEKELSRKEFFDKLAENLEHLKGKSDSIGFCFSYPMKITEEGDGVLLGFSKEVKAPEVVGSHIGKSLSDALVAHGWKKPARITLLNDTVAALLAGAAAPNIGNEYSSNIGLILGTGLNAAYIQPAINGNKDFKNQQIVVCESGKFCEIVRSDFDKELDTHTVKPGTFFMEKVCSGAYLGPQAFYALQAAAKDGYLSEKCAKAVLQLEKLTLIELDAFLHAPYNKGSTIGKLCSESATNEDYEFIFETLDAIVERSARYAATILTACVIQSGKGKEASKPVCILCNGTTYHKTYKIAERVKGYLEQYLTTERGLFWETMIRIVQSI